MRKIVIASCFLALTAAGMLVAPSTADAQYRRGGVGISVGTGYYGGGVYNRGYYGGSNYGRAYYGNNWGGANYGRTYGGGYYQNPYYNRSYYPSNYTNSYYRQSNYYAPAVQYTW